VTDRGRASRGRGRQAYRQVSRGKQADKVGKSERRYSDLPATPACLRTRSACVPPACLPTKWGLLLGLSGGSLAASAARSYRLLAIPLACAMLLAACAETQDPRPNTSSTTDARSGELRVDIDGDAVTVRARGVSLREIVDTIASRSGLALRLHGPLKERVDLDVHALPLNEALHRILREHSFALERTTTSKDAPAGTLWIFPKGSTHAATSPHTRVGPAEGSNTLDAYDDIERLSAAMLDANANTRLDAVSALAEVDSDQSAAPLAAAALHDADSSVRAEAVYALSAIADDGRSSESLQRALLDPSTQVRQAAVRAFEAIGGERSAQSLAVALNDADGSVRAAAVDALSEIGGHTATRLLRTALIDENTIVREAAVEALEATPGPRRTPK
jgi:HEAT repeats